MKKSHNAIAIGVLFQSRQLADDATEVQQGANQGFSLCIGLVKVQFFKSCLWERAYRKRRGVTFCLCVCVWVSSCVCVSTLCCTVAWKHNADVSLGAGCCNSHSVKQWGTYFGNAAGSLRIKAQPMQPRALFEHTGRSKVGERRGGGGGGVTKRKSGPKKATWAQKHNGAFTHSLRTVPAMPLTFLLPCLACDPWPLEKWPYPPGYSDPQLEREPPHIYHHKVSS